MNNQITSFIKWVVLIIVAALAFYIVCPKYNFIREGDKLFRANTISGKVELWRWDISPSRWQNVLDLPMQQKGQGP
jgi:hypothetical protein